MGFTPVNRKVVPTSKNGKGGQIPVRRDVFMKTKLDKPVLIKECDANPYNFPQVRGRASNADVNLADRWAQKAPLSARAHIADVSEAPTYYPSQADFTDPAKYIESLRLIGEMYGMVKIVPPASWRPEFDMDTDLFMFRSERQMLNQSDNGERLRAAFYNALTRFHKSVSTGRSNAFKVPVLEGRELDMYQLLRLVHLHGDYENVSRLKKWAQVGQELGFNKNNKQALSAALRYHFQKWLLPFDKFLRSNGVNLGASARVVEFGVLEDDEKAKENQKLLPYGLTVTMECSDTNDDSKWLIPNSQLSRHVKPSIPWNQGHYDDTAPFSTSGGIYNLRHFQEKARNFTEKYFTNDDLNEQAVENEYWRLLSTGTECLDIERAVGVIPGSAFPKASNQAWNLQKLTLGIDSCLRYVSQPVQWLDDTHLDAGMLFSTQSWGYEEMLSYGVCFSHLGKARTWYAVPSSHFNEMNSIIGTRGNNKMIHPQELKAKNLSVYALDQYAGEIIVTFSKTAVSYFNHGFNLCESVNYFPGTDWIANGPGIASIYANSALQIAFSVDYLVLSLPQVCDNIQMLRAAVPVINEVRERERTYTQRLKSLKREFRQIQDPVRCAVTQQWLWVSFVVRPGGEIVAPNVQDVSDNCTFVTAYADIDQTMDALIAAAESKLLEPLAWLRGLTSTLVEQHRPPLKELESILQTGLDMKMEILRCHIQFLEGLVHHARHAVNEVHQVLDCKRGDEKPSIAKLELSYKLSLETACSDDQFTQASNALARYDELLEKVTHFVNDPGANTKDIVARLDALVEELQNYPYSTPITEVLAETRRKITWTNDVVAFINSQPRLNLGQLKNIVENSQQSGIPTTSAFFRVLSDRLNKSSQLTIAAAQLLRPDHADGYYLAQHINSLLARVDDQDADIDDNLRAQLITFLRAAHILQSMSSANPADRPLMSAVLPYAMTLMRINHAVIVCNQWLSQMTLDPKLLLEQIELAVANISKQGYTQERPMFVVSIAQLGEWLSHRFQQLVLPDNIDVLERIASLLPMLKEEPATYLLMFGLQSN